MSERDDEVAQARDDFRAATESLIGDVVRLREKVSPAAFVQRTFTPARIVVAIAVSGVVLAGTLALRRIFR